MRRLARHLLTLCSAASLVLFVTVLVLWGRSYGDVDHFYRAPTLSFEFDRSILSHAGEIHVHWRASPLAKPVWRWRSYPPVAFRPPEVIRRLGLLPRFHAGYDVVPENGDRWANATVPHSAAVLAFAALPLLRLAHRIRTYRRRKRAGVQVGGARSGGTLAPVSTISALLFVFVTTMWVTSYWHTTRCRMRATDAYGTRYVQGSEITSTRGVLTVFWNGRHDESWPLDGVQWSVADLSAAGPKARPSATLWERVGFTYDDLTLPVRSGGSGWRMTLPHWVVVAPVAVLPAVWLGLRWRGRRRHRVGCCQKCGYDLRATPDRGPECGTPAPTTAAVPAPLATAR